MLRLQNLSVVSPSSHQFPSKCVFCPRSVEPEDDDPGTVAVEVFHDEVIPLLLGGGVGLESLAAKYRLLVARGKLVPICHSVIPLYRVVHLVAEHSILTSN